MKPTNFKQTCKYNNNMKTKEEIEQLAFKSYGDTLLKGSFIHGYNQCQEDMAKELEMHILVNEHDWSRNPQAQLNDFINSLNKQDNDK